MKSKKYNDGIMKPEEYKAMKNKRKLDKSSKKKRKKQ